jgi:hypothetical protein
MITNENFMIRCKHDINTVIILYQMLKLISLSYSKHYIKYLKVNI